jgi:hypothetical protein
MSKQNFSANAIFADEDGLSPGYGLSKKELCAFMAMQGILANTDFESIDEEVVVNQAIVLAYEMCKQLGIGHE